jgi:NodT family efflux transporter outer membrane factor (OMF) lipoprotein
VQARTQLDTARVEDTDVGVYRSQYEHAIATFVGKPPADFGLPPSPLDSEPPVIPVGLPSQLLERRPDIAASERRVAEANEGIGIARAAYFPNLVLSATGGFEGSSIANWFAWPSRFWAIGPTMMETLFDAGRRRATSEAALANYDATVANYRETTLTAFQQVEDNLSALRILEQEGLQQKEAVAEAQRGVQLFTARYEPVSTPTFRSSPLRPLPSLTSGTMLTFSGVAWMQAFYSSRDLAAVGKSRSYLKSARCTDLSQRQDTYSMATPVSQ